MDNYEAFLFIYTNERFYRPYTHKDSCIHLGKIRSNVRSSKSSLFIYKITDNRDVQGMIRLLRLAWLYEEGKYS